MVYDIFWSEFAEIQLEAIFNFYLNIASEKVAKKIIESILKTPEILIKTPQLGQKEENLENRKIDYRYIICGNHKIIYSVNDLDKSILIADVFDTRQNPEKISRSTRP